MSNYFDGARMAYGDCAEMAEKLAIEMDRFVFAAKSSGLDEGLAKGAAETGKTVLLSFAESVRTKIDIMNQMVHAAKNGLQ